MSAVSSVISPVRQDDAAPAPALACKPEMLVPGCRLKVPRSNGTIQDAAVIEFDDESNCVHVEWLQGNDVKTKSVPVHELLTLNPQFQIAMILPPDSQVMPSTSQSTASAHSQKEAKYFCSTCEGKFIREKNYRKHIEAKRCKPKSSKLRNGKNRPNNAARPVPVLVQTHENDDDDDDDDDHRTARVVDKTKPPPAVEAATANDEPTVCAHAGCKRVCKGTRGLAQHTRFCHQDVARTRLIDAAPNGLPVRTDKDDANTQIEQERQAIHTKFYAKFLSLVRDAAIDPGNDGENRWTRFDSVYNEYVAHLRSVQPEFYASPKRKKSNRKGRQRRSPEQVDAAREAFKFREAQFNFHHNMRNLRRQINGAEPDPAVFTAAELYQYYDNVFGHVNDKVASIDQMPFTLQKDEQRDADVVVSEQQFRIEPGEVLKALRGLSNEVAAGPDKLRVKTIKTYDNEGKILALIFTMCFICKKIPAAWRQGTTPVLPKPRKDPLLIENRRPITIVSVVRRIYGRVINLRMEPYTKIHHAQKGFRGGFGLIENVHLVRETIANARAEGRTLYIISYDAIKAFDSIGHAHLFAAMERMGIPVDIIDAVKSMYTGFVTQIAHKGVRTRAVNVLRGVLQGCPCSPTLFNIAINFIINLLHSKFAGRGYSVDDENEILSCAFADDLLVCSSDGVNAAEMCIAVIEWLRNIGLEINVSKSNALILNDSADNIAEFRRRVPITIVNDDEFIRYLGADVSANAAPQFSELGAKIAHECQSIIDFKYLRLTQKLHVFDSTTISKLVYPAQIYCTGMQVSNDGSRRPLVKHPTFQRIFEVMWDAQTEIVGLWPTSPKHFMRGDMRRRCLGLREPRWVVNNNAAISADTIRRSTDDRVLAINKANCINFDALISEHLKASVSALGGATAALEVQLTDDNNDSTKENDAATLVASTSDDAGALCEQRESGSVTLPLLQALISIVNDAKKMKAQRLTAMLKAAAADCWQRSTSGRLAGTNVTDQVLNANNWRRLFGRSSDGAIRLCIKLMGEQHSLRCRGGNFIAKTSGEGDVCRGCRLPGQRETTQHVLGGTCTGTNKMAIDRHDLVQHHVAKMIAFPNSDGVPSRSWRVTENSSFPTSYQHHKPDLLIDSSDNRSCYLLDPTIGFETDDDAVNSALAEKARKYQPLLAESRNRGFVNAAVTGLWFGARGILHKPTIDFLCKTFGIDIRRLLPIAEITMNYTAYTYQRVVSDTVCARRKA